MKKIILLSTLLSAITLSTIAQQTSNFTQAFVNPYLLSPTYAGNSTDLRAFAHYRNQLVGFKGAPESMLFSLDKGLPHERMGIGLQVYNDKMNFIQRFGANLSYSYLVPINEIQSIRFGLSAGYVNTGIDLQSVIASNSEELEKFARLRPNANFTSDFGVTYMRKKLQAGISVTNINYAKPQLESRSFAYLQNPVYQLFVGYELPIINDLTFNPLVIARSSQGTEIMVSANAIFNFKKMFWGGLTYDSRSSVGGTVGLIFDNFTLGYNYGYPTSALATISAGIHEVCVGYNFGSKPKPKAPSDQVSADNYAVPSSTDEVPKPDVKFSNTKRSDTLYHVFIMKDGIDPDFLKKSFNDDIQNIYAEEPQGMIDEVAVENYAKLESKESEVRFKKDFPKGKASVILAAYYKFEDVKKYQKILQKRANMSTTVIRSKNETYYLVASKEVTNYSEALKEMNRIKKQRIGDLIFGNIWLY